LCAPGRALAAAAGSSGCELPGLSASGDEPRRRTSEVRAPAPRARSPDPHERTKRRAGHCPRRRPSRSPPSGAWPAWVASARTIFPRRIASQSEWQPRLRRRHQQRAPGRRRRRHCRSLPRRLPPPLRPSSRCARRQRRLPRGVDSNDCGPSRPSGRAAAERCDASACPSPLRKPEWSRPPLLTTPYGS
jgi:hypothetical protein